MCKECLVFHGTPHHKNVECARFAHDYGMYFSKFPVFYKDLVVKENEPDIFKKLKIPPDEVSGIIRIYTLPNTQMAAGRVVLCQKLDRVLCQKLDRVLCQIPKWLLAE